MAASVHPAPISPIGIRHGISLAIKRDDLMDALVGGNKIYKLKFNIEEAKRQGKTAILTFGGAFSNHIAATAKLCHDHGLASIGIIRGERIGKLNPTLMRAETHGMRLEFISRTDYRTKNDPAFIEHLKEKYGNPYIIPEGGANLLGIEGAKAMLNENTSAFTHIVVAMGTGTTFAGLVHAAQPHQKIIGLPIHRHDKLLDDITAIDPSFAHMNPDKYAIVNGYHFGGYAKWNDELLMFIQNFRMETSIPLDPVYTGKALFGCLDLMSKGFFPEGAQVLFIHTGGMQAFQF